MERKRIYDLVDAERDRQSQKHQTNSMEARKEEVATQLICLGKQYGQACSAVQAAKFESEAGARVYDCGRYGNEFRHELVSIAAVAVAMLEMMGE